MQKTFATLLATAATTVATTAQDLDISIGSDGISIDSKEWYENPIFWVVGLLVLILVVVLVTRTSKA